MKLARFVCHVFLLQLALSAVTYVVTGNTLPTGSNTIEDTISGDSVYNESVSDNSGSSSSSHHSLSDGTTHSNGYQHELQDVPEDTLQVTEIHSSFEEVTKSNVPKDNVAVNDRSQILLNQGTLSEEASESGTLGILSATDSATAELKNRVVSMSTDFMVDKSGETTHLKNASGDSTPPIVILPPGDAGSSKSADREDLQLKASSPPSSPPSSTPDPSHSPDLSQPPVVRAEPKIVVKAKEKITPLEQDVNSVPAASEPAVIKEQGASEPTSTTPPSATSNIDLVGVPTSESPHEEIPSFSEWTQKQLEEAERKKGQNKTSSSSPPRVAAPSKLRSKNYASPDCGAKIVAANPEAENPNGILSPSKDEYVLNKCSTQRKWLIIELCEPIQAKKLELANFELFSSSPKDFSVSLSHNYPSREWSSVGQFTARDERDVQSFNLHPHLFGKFLKVEFNTHHGQEHFCCTSLIRVYGTSEFEVLETESEVPGLEDGEEDEDELPIGADMGKPTKNLFGHATEAVYSIVKKAAEALVKSGDRHDQSKSTEQQNVSAVVPAVSTPSEHCSTVRHLVVCNNCSEDFFNKVYKLLSCRPVELQALINTPFVLDGLNNSQLCSIYGIDFTLRRSGRVPLRIKHEDQLDHAGYLAAMLSAEYISALCNIFAVNEGKVVLNNSHTAALKHRINLIISPPLDYSFKKIVIEPELAPTCSMDESFSSSQCKSRDTKTDGIDVTSSLGIPMGATHHSSVASMIRPTKTLSKDDEKMESVGPSGDAELPVAVPISILTQEMPFVGDSSHVTVHPSVLTRTNLEHASTASDGPSIEVSSNFIPEIPTPEQPSNESPPPNKETTDSGDGLESASHEDPEHSKDLEAIIQEMKALDNNEETSTESNSAASGSTTPSSVVTQTRIPAQQAQKESVFLRLSNRIKALERNMSLSGQYLEELSRRYKKQEELSRALNKTLVLLHEEVRRSKEKELQHNNDVVFLKAKLLELSASIESLHAERDSWHQKAAVVSQHLIVILIEVVMFGLVVWICRRLPPDPAVTSPPQRKLSSVFYKFNRQSGKPRRRNSFEDARGTKELKKRRPSEELLYISSSYQDIPLKDDKVVVVEGVDLSPSVDTSTWSSVGHRDQRRKRKRRKDFMIKSNSSENLSQLTVDCSNSSRKISAPSHPFHTSTERFYEESSSQEPVQHVVVPREPNPSSPSERLAENLSESAGTFNSCLSQTGNGIPNVDSMGTFPVFMETASSARSRRSFNYGENKSTIIHELNNGHDRESGSSVSHQSSHSRGLDDQGSELTSSHSDGQDAFAVGVEKKKKVGKKGGLKNMVKKFF